ncbi:hypothetical protein PsorP6_010871 [Peronosclerospora sorghi]|uniref:Uncharacterized protein n=1 Tax=Peronosclerospora sorghi TaxID=230839 RepID=A0ACC0VXR3_9STRA|nr:hypothetical protein PsorP6_010871 [Peronosclerospora sorghi]
MVTIRSTVHGDTASRNLKGSSPSSPATDSWKEERMELPAPSKKMLSWFRKNPDATKKVPTVSKWDFERILDDKVRMDPKGTWLQEFIKRFKAIKVEGDVKYATWIYSLTLRRKETIHLSAYMNENVSEYEAKRLRRIAENRLRLQDLNLPTLSENPSSSVKCAKRKREVKENSPEPPRRSSRHRQKQNLENELQQNSEPQIEWQGLEKVDKNEQIQGKHVETMLKHKWKQDAETLEVETKGAKWDQEAQAQEVKSSDWRLRRKLQAREEKRQRTLKRREERRARRLKEMKQLIKIKKRERKRRKKQKEDAKLAREVQKELERQQRVEDREQMREEDRLARQVAKQRVNDAKQHQLQQKYAGWNQNLEEIFKARRNMTRKREHEGNQTMYPVQRLNDLPFVRISDSMEASASKPLVLTPLLRVDVDLFHAFSLGKQFLPPGKKSALQGLCPGGYTLEFDDNPISLDQNKVEIVSNSSVHGIFMAHPFRFAIS